MDDDFVFEVLYDSTLGRIDKKVYLIKYPTYDTIIDYFESIPRNYTFLVRDEDHCIVRRNGSDTTQLFYIRRNRDATDESPTDA